MGEELISAWSSIFNSKDLGDQGADMDDSRNPLIVSFTPVTTLNGYPMLLSVQAYSVSRSRADALVLQKPQFVDRT